MKKFISGILGKKEDQSKETKAEEEVPDELPPLAEDVVSKVSESKETKKDEVPAELPSLEESLDKDSNKDSSDQGTIIDLEKENIPEEIKRAKLAKITKAAEGKAPAEAKTEDFQKLKEENYSINERIKSGSEIGFFSNLLEHIKRHGGAKERLLSGNLFSRMDNYWELRKHEIKTGTKLPAEKKLEEDLVKKLEELRMLEQKWQVQKLALDEDMKFIHEREMEIQSKIEELRIVSNELNLFRNVKPEEYFYMHNGVVIKNLHDLVDILEIIDEETFNFHVKHTKNDFSDWIRHIFKDTILADKIKNTKTKMEMIEILETIPVVTENEKDTAYNLTNPKKYFWLANGIVIRNLYELSDALKIMDDELFNRHVNKNKNDFAEWMAHISKNEHLVEKLKSAKSKKEMIEILEVFL